MASRPGLVGDDEWAGLAAAAAGRVHVRTVISELAPTCGCCLATPPLIVAVSPDDPTLPDGLGRTMRQEGLRVALATAGAAHAAGTRLVADRSIMPVRPAAVVGDAAVVVHDVDARPLLSASHELVTTAVFRRRPGAAVPEGWTGHATGHGRVALSTGWRSRSVVAAAAS